MAKAPEKIVANVAAPNSALPAYLQNKQKTVKIGNVDATDLIIPRVKLLQSTSDEITTHENAKPGVFWHTIAAEPLGDELVGIPILVRKTFVLWSPRGDDRGMLARSSDGVNWDDQFRGLEFTVKPKKATKEVVYKLGNTPFDITQNGLSLADFGSSIPGNENSPPAASLTYEMLWLFPDFLEMSPAIILNTRSQVKPAQLLLSKIEQRPTDHYYQQYRIGVIREPADEGFYFNYKYNSDGYAPEDLGALAKEKFEHFSKVSFRANDQSEEVAKNEDGAPKSTATRTEKTQF